MPPAAITVVATVVVAQAAAAIYLRGPPHWRTCPGPRNLSGRLPTPAAQCDALGSAAVAQSEQRSRGWIDDEFAGVAMAGVSGAFDGARSGANDPCPRDLSSQSDRTDGNVSGPVVGMGFVGRFAVHHPDRCDRWA